MISEEQQQFIVASKVAAKGILRVLTGVTKLSITAKYIPTGKQRAARAETFVLQFSEDDNKEVMPVTGILDVPYPPPVHQPGDYRAGINNEW